MHNVDRELEQRLCELFGRRYCTLVGRGAAAIYVGLRALPAKSGKVVMPAVLCPSPPSVALYAGFEPVFCDVGLDDYNLDPESLLKLLQRHKDVVAVMPVHLYGQPAKMDRILEIARDHGLYVIEDVAQAMGGEYRGKKLGSFGEMSIVSFGHTKILDVGWGGAILVDDPGLASRIREEAERLPECPANIQELFADYRQVYYSLRPLVEKSDRLNDLFLPLPDIFRDMYVFKSVPGASKDVLGRMDRLRNEIELRRENAVEYERRLRHEDIELPRNEPGGVPWRFSFLLRKPVQKQVTEQLRASGIDVSNWYPPLYNWFKAGKAQGSEFFPNSEHLGARIMNLWVSPLNKTAIAKNCDTLLKILDNLPLEKGQKA